MGVKEKESRIDTSKKRVFVKAVLMALVGGAFWLTSRYPDLVYEAQRANMDALIERDLGTISKGEVMSTQDLQDDSFQSKLTEIGRTTMNWMETNKIGMSFGIIFGGAFLALIAPFMKVMKYFSFGGIKGAFLGTLMGTPLGVCANCVAPIGLAMKRKGVSLTTTLSTMFASPTLNVVALFITFLVFPLSLALTKVLGVLVLIFGVVPFVVKKFAPEHAAEEKNKEKVKLTFEDESWSKAIKGGVFSFVKEVFRLAILVVPLMILAGLLGAVFVTFFPLDTLVINPYEASIWLILAAAVLGTLLPIPMLVDIILTLGLVEAGLNLGVAGALLITMPIYSIFSAFIIKKYFYPKLASVLFISVVAVGTLGGFMLNILAPREPASFENVIDESGLDAKFGFGAGRGSVWVDYDNDGDDDLFFNNTLYNNIGNGQFEVAKNSGFPERIDGMGSIGFGDYNNDGCKDAYISMIGTNDTSAVPSDDTQDLLFKNNCDGTFTDVTAQSGIQDLYRGFGVSWVDYNQDGYLDIYVANAGRHEDSEEIPEGQEIEYRSEPNVLYRNNGDGTFTDVTELAGVTGEPKCTVINGESLEDGQQHEIDIKLKPSFQPIWFDYDNDRDSDLFVATDSFISPMYENRGDGTFEDITEQAGLCVQGTGMGVTVGDYNEDGYFDIYITNVGQNFLWRNNQDGTFTEVSADVGVGELGWGWGTSFFDYDNDGDLDLYVANDSPTREDKNDHGRKKSNSLDELYRNNGEGVFESVSIEEGIYGNFPKKTVSFSDYNQDGFLDILVGYILEFDRTTRGANQLYRNIGNDNHWLMIDLVGNESNKDAVGARVNIEHGEKSQMREVISGDSYLSQNSHYLHFGLGQDSNVDKLSISWPSGKTQVFENISSNQRMVIEEE